LAAPGFLDFTRGTLLADLRFIEKEKIMADVYNNHGEQRPRTADLNSYNAADEAPRNISRATWLMIGATVLFLIIFGILMAFYLSYPAGGGANG
jgi:hypothetical protein